MNVRLLTGCLVVLAATFVGCASGSAATAARTRGFNVEEFFTKDPRDLRVALRTDDRARRGPADPSLVARATVGANEPLCYALALIPVPASTQETAPEKPPADRRWHVFMLSAEGTDTFERARREVKSSSAGGNLNVTVALNDVIVYADDPQGSPLRIDFALDRRTGWFTMLTETTVRPTGSTSRPAAPCGA